MNLKRTAIALVALAAAYTPVLAETSFTMDFDGIPKANTAAELGLKGVAEILGYYNGDPGPAPVFPRDGNQPFGVTFGPGALAIDSKEAKGPGQFPTAHSGNSAAGSVGGAVKFEFSAGLSLTAFEFWYDTLLVMSKPKVQLFSGGKEVFVDELEFCRQLPPQPPDNLGFCGWTQYVLAESELAQLAATGTQVTAVVFTAVGNTAVFDDVFLSTATQTQPIPEPSSAALAALGLALAAGIAQRRGG